jgi:2-polyprenyl-3-methyl-5-hydroxy-6-metoxy-1,4-benzoquinol methylase
MGRAFDLIFACDVLVHLGDLSQVFAQVYDSLAINGMLVFSTELLAGTASPNACIVLVRTYEIPTAKHQTCPQGDPGMSEKALPIPEDG